MKLKNKCMENQKEVLESQVKRIHLILRKKQELKQEQ
jgi:hypothetical protein